MKETKIGQIYKLTNPETGKIYIGSTTLKYYCHRAGQGYKENKELCEDLIRLGYKNFHPEFIEKVDGPRKLVMERERYWTHYYASLGFEMYNKYNVKPHYITVYEREDGVIFTKLEKIAEEEGYCSSWISQCIKKQKPIGKDKHIYKKVRIDKCLIER